MKAYEERKIEIPGFTLALKVWHSKAITPVLCLHGKLDNAASFDLLAPLLPHLQLAAIDYPGTGFSSHYPSGVIPYWKNDAFLLLQLLKALEWEQFDIIAHSLGSILAAVIAIVRPTQVRKLVLLDILGPTVNFMDRSIEYLRADAETYLAQDQQTRVVYPDQEAAINERMKRGNISYQAAAVLTQRGTIKSKEGWVWTFDPRLHGVSSTIPHEDEVRAILKAIKAPVCLIRAEQGVPYPEAIFQARAEAIKNLTIHEVPGRHHVHMDDPVPVAKIVSQFLSGS